MIEKVLVVILYHYFFFLTLSIATTQIAIADDSHPWYLDFKFYMTIIVLSCNGLNFKLAIIDLLNAWSLS